MKETQEASGVEGASCWMMLDGVGMRLVAQSLCRVAKRFLSQADVQEGLITLLSEAGYLWHSNEAVQTAVTCCSPETLNACAFGTKVWPGQIK